MPKVSKKAYASDVKMGVHLFKKGVPSMYGLPKNKTLAV